MQRLVNSAGVFICCCALLLAGRYNLGATGVFKAGLAVIEPQVLLKTEYAEWLALGQGNDVGRDVWWVTICWVSAVFT